MLGLVEIGALMDVLPQGALLINTNHNEIVLANARATEITSFTRLEFQEIDLEGLLPDFCEDEITNFLDDCSENGEIRVIKRNGNQLLANATLTSLDSEDRWVLLTFEPVSRLMHKERETVLRDRRWEAIQTMASALQLPNIKTAFNEILLAGHLLTGANILAIYNRSKQDFILSRSTYWGTVDDLPPIITSHEIKRMKPFLLWTPGRRVLCSLHRSALTVGFNYIASFPISQNENIEGIIVVADHLNDAPDDIEDFLRILATMVTTTSMYFANTSELLLDIQKQSKSSALTNTLNEIINEGIILTDLDLSIQYLNPSAEALLGFSRTEVEGEHVQNIIIGNKPFSPALKAAQSGKSTLNIGDVILNLRDGSTALIHPRIVPVVTDKKVDNIAIILSDLRKIEEYKKTTEQLKQSATLGELSSIFSHEVRNPIYNISSSLQLMNATVSKDDPTRKKIDNLLIECARLDDLVKTVLAFSTTRKSSMVPFDLGLLVKRILEKWRSKMSHVNVEYILQVSPKTPYVIGDKRSLERVFTNLISNAVNAMREQGGSLAVKIQTDGSQNSNPNMVLVTVSDTGPGIPEDMRENIFKLYYTTNEQGYGLGLVITKKLVSLHNGQIMFESFPGGTIFKINLPCTDKLEYQRVQGAKS
jgi:PAS domain S-box-containing protein